MTEQYKPSDAVIEQIAKEWFENFWSKTYALKNISFDNSSGTAISLTSEIVTTPTILKALELYENQPQWQDKPDKEGYWSVVAKEENCRWSWLYTPDSAVYAYKKMGTIHIKFNNDNLTLSQFLKQYSYERLKFFYHPIPEPYKESGDE